MNASNYNALMSELRLEYLQSFAEKYSTLRECFSQSDWYSIELEYHKLKGTGATYGVPEVTELCRHLERICRETKKIDKQTLETSIELLERIKEKYLENSEFELISHPDFQKISQL